MANKKTLFSIAVVINSDGTYQDKIVLEPGGEVLAATFLFNRINGTVSSTILDYIKKKYPNQFEKVDSLVERLCNEFVNNTIEEVVENDNSPYIKASEVFGGKHE